MSTPEPPREPDEAPEGWTRRQTLALVPAALVAPGLAGAETRPMPRPAEGDRVFAEGVFEEGVFE